jgi:hypothetical protein
MGGRNKDRKEISAEGAFIIDQVQLNGIRPGTKDLSLSGRQG